MKSKNRKRNKATSLKESKQNLYLIIIVLALEYTTFLMTLFNQRRLAVNIFYMNIKYQAIIYFELILALTYLLANLLVLFLIRRESLSKILHEKEHIIFSSVSIYVLFFILIPLLPATATIRICCYILTSVFFTYFYVRERIITIHYLIQTIRSYKLYHSFRKVFFIIFSFSLLLANIIHAITTLLPDDNKRIIFSFAPLLILITIINLWSRKSTIEINPKNIHQMSVVINFISQDRKSQMFRLIINMTIGGLLVEWYFYTPSLKIINTGWNYYSINFIIVGINFLALILIAVLPKYLNLISQKLLLIVQLILFSSCAIGIDIFPTDSFVMIPGFFIMTVCFNQIVQTVNKIIHYDIYQLSVNTFFLIWGSGIGIILFCFIYNIINNLLFLYSDNLSLSIISNYSLLVLTVTSIIATINLQLKS